MNLPFKTLTDLLQYFNHEEKCRDFLEKMRWPDGCIICPYCVCKYCYRNSDMKTYKCRKKECKARFTVLVGTIMEATKLPLQKWFAAAWLVTNHKKGVSSCQLARDLGIGQKAAWFLIHRIREMIMDKEPELLCNTCEVDEMYVGGSISNMTKTRRKYHNDYHVDNKVPVMGLLERGGNVRLEIIGRHDTFKDVVKRNINQDAVIVTDEHGAYKGLENDYKGHFTVNHSMLEYKNGEYWTNGIEGFFSIFKRTIFGTYHKISVKHLNRYCQETSYRYNTRKTKDADRFKDVMSKTEGRLTWNKLTGKKM